MKTALIVLVCLSFMPYIMAWVAGYYRKKQLGRIDNQRPREQYSQLRGPGARAVSAQQNSWETLGVYTASLVAVIGSNANIEHLSTAAIIVLVGRIFHGIFYLANIDQLRSFSFVVAIAPCFYLFYKAIVAL